MVEALVFTLWAVVVSYNLGVQLYIHQEAYPIMRVVGKNEFPAYLGEFEKRLTVPLLVPYALTVLSNIALIFIHPDGVSVILVILALVLNLVVAGISVMVATPVYDRYKSGGEPAAADLAQLIQINWLRFGISTASVLVVIFVLVDLLS